jgi:hypothetical protein
VFTVRGEWIMRSRINLGKNQLGFWDEINWDFGHEINKKKHYDFGENKNRLFYLFSREDKHSNKLCKRHNLYAVSRVMFFFSSNFVFFSSTKSF